MYLICVYLRDEDLNLCTKQRLPRCVVAGVGAGGWYNFQGVKVFALRFFDSLLDFFSRPSGPLYKVGCEYQFLCSNAVF